MQVDDSQYAEMAVLGILLTDSDMRNQFIGNIREDYFVSSINREIFKSIYRLSPRSIEIDPVVVFDDTKSKGVTYEYLLEIYSSIMSANIEEYIDILAEAGKKRALSKVLWEINGELGNGKRADDILNIAERKIFKIAQMNEKGEAEDMSSILVKVGNKIETNEFGVNDGIKTKFYDLDDMTGGLVKQNLIILAGRPSMGKTMFALNFVRNIAFSGVPVLMFSLEMEKTQLAVNMMAGCIGANPRDFVGKVRPDIYQKYVEASRMFSNVNILIDDTAATSLRDVVAKSRRAKTKHNIGLIVIDYIQLLELGEKADNRQQEITKISRQLKILARELDVPVVALSQLNRSVDAREDHRPRMSDLRESGALEQDADLVMFLYRDEYYYPESQRKNIAEVIIAKQRNGPTGTIEMIFNKNFLRFAPIAREKP